MIYGKNPIVCGPDYFQLLDALYFLGFNAAHANSNDQHSEFWYGEMTDWDAAERTAFWNGWETWLGEDMDDEEPDDRFADGDALASAGFGTDEDYGGIGGEDW